MPILVNKKITNDLTACDETEVRGSGDVSSTQGPAVERRAKPRINAPFPTRVWAFDLAGNAFELDCVLDNLSARGVYLRLPKPLVSGDDLSLLVTFVMDAKRGAKALLRCEILRTDPEVNGQFGIAAAIKKHHFL